MEESILGNTRMDYHMVKGYTLFGTEGSLLEYSRMGQCGMVNFMTKTVNSWVENEWV